MMPGDKFCPACASPLEVQERDGKQRPVCRSCGRVVYFDPKVVATSILERGGKILMVRRANQPGYGLWSMPGGYVDRGEVVEEAAVREVREETGLDVEVRSLVGLFSEPGQTVMVAVYLVGESGGRLTAGAEVLDVGFFPPGDLPPLAFPRDGNILQQWQSLRGNDELR